MPNFEHSPVKLKPYVLHRKNKYATIANRRSVLRLFQLSNDDIFHSMPTASIISGLVRYSKILNYLIKIKIISGSGSVGSTFWCPGAGSLIRNADPDPETKILSKNLENPSRNRSGFSHCGSRILIRIKILRINITR